MTDEADREDGDQLWLGGLDPQTGLPAAPPIDLHDLAQTLRDRAPWAGEPPTRLRAVEPGFGLDLAAPEEVGWGLVTTPDTPEAVREALRPLLEHRRDAVGDALYKELVWRPGESVRAFSDRHGVAPGSLEPELLPYYLLLVGPPTQLPFRVQYGLGVEHAVGRLDLEHPADYARYAQAMVAREQGGPGSLPRTWATWAPRNRRDAATRLSASQLVTPLAEGLEGSSPRLRRPIHAEVGWSLQRAEGDDATRGALLDALGGARTPALLFTAGHGLACPAGATEQRADQGALVSQDWPGRGPVLPEHRVGADSLDDGVDLRGLIAFLFACYGAGTPDHDEFPLKRPDGSPLPPPAPAAFTSALARRLLTGGAGAVLGHVDRAWSFSFQPPARMPPQITPFRNALGLMMVGKPVGHALCATFGGRYAALSTLLLSDTAPTLAADQRLADLELVTRWLERNDAQNYVVLGDPAARVAV